MAYSMDMRLKVLDALDGGESVRCVSERFGIGVDAVRDYRRRREEHGEPVRFKTGPKKPIKLTPADDTTMLAMIAENPGVTLREIATRMSVKVAESTLSRRLTALGITLKKNR